MYVLVFIPFLLPLSLPQVPVVRVHAVAALELLQDGENPQCPVVGTLLELLRGDSSPEVRRSALSKILVTNSTLQGTISLASFSGSTAQPFFTCSKKVEPISYWTVLNFQE